MAVASVLAVAQPHISLPLSHPPTPPSHATLASSLHQSPTSDLLDAVLSLDFALSLDLVVLALVFVAGLALVLLPLA